MATKTTATKSASQSTAKKATKSAGAGAAKKATKKVSSKRELIAPNGDKRLIRRDDQGRIKESDDLSASLSQDVRKTSKKVVKAGQGDRGDQKKPAKAKK
jgi:exo-beta-1,3-glucanase (GH17 family)